MVSWERLHGEHGGDGVVEEQWSGRHSLGLISILRLPMVKVIYQTVRKYPARIQAGELKPTGPKVR